MSFLIQDLYRFFTYKLWTFNKTKTILHPPPSKKDKYMKLKFKKMNHNNYNLEYKIPFLYIKHSNILFMEKRGGGRDFKNMAAEN